MPETKPGVLTFPLQKEAGTSAVMEQEPSLPKAL